MSDSVPEVPLPGGGMGGAVRVGSSVRRTAGPWTPSVQRLLAHLEASGVEGVPRPLGLDASGRDAVSYLPGEVPQYPMPDYVWSDENLVAAGRLLREVHAATARFDWRDETWRLPAHEPAEVVCHNDVAPYNLVFDAGRLTGLVDWDTCSPGPRVWDLAYLAYRLVPLGDGADSGPLAGRIDEQRRRLRLLCDSYAPGPAPRDVLVVAVDRLLDLAAWTQARAGGDAELLGHVELYRGDAAWIAGHSDVLLLQEN